MRLVEPEVYVLATTRLTYAGVVDYLEGIGAESWWFNEDAYPRSDADEIVELAGRTCYMSFGTDLNENISRVREDPKDYLTNILASGHGSVLEHASVTFAFHNVSRVFTHELITHRVGTAKSQESLRFVRHGEIRMWLPPELESVRKECEEVGDLLENFQRELAEKLGVSSLSFEQKKKVTSAMRRFMPEGIATTVVWTSNLRNLRHVIEARTSRHAEREIRLVFAAVAAIAQEQWPLLFGDYVAEEVDGINEYTTSYQKV